MRAVGLVAGLGLVGCGAMESPLAIVDDLRVVDLRTVPAAPTAGEAFAVELLVLDALGDGFDAWSWACAMDRCDEELRAPSPGTAPFFVARSLVCAPGVCAAPDDPADPDAFLVELPFEGVSLVDRRVPLSPSADRRLVEHPVWVIEPALPAEVDLGAEVELPLVVDVPDATVEVYATAGAVPGDVVQTVDGAATALWTAPDQPGPVDLAVVVFTEVGGRVHFAGRVQVR